MYNFSNHQIQEIERQLEVIQSANDAIKAILYEAKVNNGQPIFDEQNMFPSRTMSKSELAASQRMSTKQLAAWLRPLRPELRRMGVSDRARLLRPDVVHFICQRLHLTREDMAPDDTSASQNSKRQPR